MRKVIAAINTTLDGIGDHTAGIPDEEIHRYYADLLRAADTILYGRITFELMEFWPSLLKSPSGNAAMDDFALAMDRIPKIVFSRTLQHLEWETATLANRTLEEEVIALKHQPGKNILIGSRSLIMNLLTLNLIDEFQLCIHPVIAGGGSPLFEAIKDRTLLHLTGTKTFHGGAVMLYYTPIAG